MSANQSNSTELSDGSRRKANLPWVEKYRPNALEELISHDDIVRTIRKFISQVNMFNGQANFDLRNPIFSFLNRHLFHSRKIYVVNLKPGRL